MSHKPLIFVSYSRHDEAWRERIEQHLRVLDHVFDVWSDERIALGDTWRDEIRGALETAAAAILLVSADFLTSPFVRSEEVPVLLERRRREGLRVAPVIVKDCAWKAVPWLASMQFYPRDARPLAARTEAEQDEALADLAGELVKLLVGSDPTSFAAAHAAIDAYRCGWQAKLSHLEALHPTRLSGSDGDFTSDQMLDRLSAERLLIVVGSSGAGKSHALRHAARDAVLRGLIPLVVAVRDLDADFGRWLDRSVESLHPRTCGDLLGAAERTGTGTVLLVDVMNPLRPGQLSALVDEVGAFLLRSPMPALLTTRERGALSVAIPHARATLGDITDDDKQAIFVLHGGHCLPPSWEPFRTAFAVTLLAQCSADLGPDATFHALLAKYATQRLEHAGAGPAAFRFLSKTALDLSERLLWTISSAEFRRDAERYAETRAAAAGLGDALLHSGLVEEERGECAFAHEQLQHFFEAEALLAAHSGAALIERLVRPRHADAVPFVIEALTAPADMSAALRALAQAPLIADCLRGHHGKIAQTAAMKEARGLLRRLEVELPGQFAAALATEDAPPISPAAPHDEVLGKALGNVLRDDILLDEFTDLLACLDEAWVAATQAVATATSAHQSQVFWNVCTIPCVPLGVLCSAAETADLRYGKSLPDAARGRLSELVARREPFSLYFAAGLMRSCSAVEARLLPTLLRNAWKTRIYHVRLQALRRAAMAGVIDDETRAEVVRLLEDYLERSKNPLLNTCIFEALADLGALEPVTRADTVQSEIDLVLADPEDPECQSWAYSVVCKMFEDVFQGVYWDTVMSMEPARRDTLYAMAALAPLEADAGLDTDFAVRAIATSSVPIAETALRTHARPPKPSFYFQGNVQVFALAFAALGLRDEEPPRPERELSADESAWQMFGEMQFWLTKLRESPDQLRARCAPLWQSLLRQYAHAAVHPLRHIEQEARSDAGLDGDPAGMIGIRSIVTAFAAESARLLMHALANLDKLTSIFDTTRGYEQGEMARFAIATLGRIGSLDAIPLIEPLAEHPELGRAAVTAIRSIRARSDAADSRP